MECNEIIASIVCGKSLPEYLLITESEPFQHGPINFDICKSSLESLEQYGKQLYSVEKIFYNEVRFDMERPLFLRQKERLLYHLDTDNFTPF